MAYELDYVFDSNAIISLGGLTDAAWDRILKTWKSKGLRTKWVPWTIGEVTGSHFLRLSRPLTDEDVKEVALAVRRFDRLAAREFLPQVRELIRRSYFEYARVPNPPEATLKDEPAHRRNVDAWKHATSLSQLEYRTELDGTRCVGLRTKDGVCGLAVDTTFVQSATKGIDFWRKKLTLRPNASDEAIIESIIPSIHDQVIALGRKLVIPESILTQPKEKNRGAEFLEAGFTLCAILQTWYCIERAIRRKPGKPRENDGRDLLIGTYLSVAERIVTDDDGFTKLLRHIIREPKRIVTFAEFMDHVEVRAGSSVAV